MQKAGKNRIDSIVGDVESIANKMISSPEETVLINVFNTGIVIDTKKAMRKIVEIGAKIIEGEIKRKRKKYKINKMW